MSPSSRSMRGRVRVRWSRSMGSDNACSAAWRRSSRRLILISAADAGRAARSQRAGLAVAAREAGDLITGRFRPARSERGVRTRRSRLVDRRRLAARAGDGLALEVDRKLLFGDRPLLARAAVNRCEHGDRARLELLADLDIAVGGVADHPLRTPL